MKKLVYIAALAALALVACQNEPDKQPIWSHCCPPPFVIEETLTANPIGHPAESANEAQLLTMYFEADGAWRVEATEEYDWISVSPTSGEGNSTLTFAVTPNEGTTKRMAVFDIFETIYPINAADYDMPISKDIKTYNILVVQDVIESNVAEGSFNFLHAIVSGNMLGDATPMVDNWADVDEIFAGIRFETMADGKLEITSIDHAPFVKFPAVMNLPELTHFNISDQPELKGESLPAEWNTPNLVYVNFAGCGLCCPLPEGLASTTPKLQTLFFNGNNIYGSVPHTWAAGPNGGSGTLECIIGTGNKNNVSQSVTLPIVHLDDNPYMGYMVPATCDVKLNRWINDDPSTDRHNNPSGDKTQMKLGGCTEQHYVGFEKGWGQERYVKYGGGSATDLTTWSDHRLLADEWASYFSNVGYPDMAETVPHVMSDWDEAAADAWTAEAATLAANNEVYN